MSLLQLDPSIPVITPKGDGYAHILIDYGAEFNLLWVVFLDDSGECWTFDNTQIRAQKNVTMGRTHVSMHKAPSIAAEWLGDCLTGIHLRISMPIGWCFARCRAKGLSPQPVIALQAR